MRSTVALFFIGLIAMTMAFNADVKFLKSLKRKSYGRTLLDTIQIQIMSASKGNGIQEVVDVLQQLKASQAAEQEKDDSENAEFQTQTQQHVSELTNDINGLEKNINDDTNLIAANEGTIQTLSAFVAETKEDLALQESALSENHDTQVRETDQFNKDFASLSAQVAGLAEAKQVLVSLESESEAQAQQFIQIKASLKNIKLQHAKYQGLINVLSQIMTNQVVADPHLVANIVEIIDRLSAALQAEVKQLQASFEQRIADLQTIQAHLEASIEEDKENIQTSEARIAQLQQDNADAAQRNLQNGQSLASAISQRNDAVQAGVDRQHSHDTETQRRNDENQVIDQVVEIFTTRFSADVQAVVRTL